MGNNKSNNKKSCKKYILLITIIFSIYIIVEFFIFYKKSIAIFSLFNSIVGFIIAICSIIAGIKVNIKVGIYISILVIVMIIFTYFCDLNIEEKQKSLEEGKELKVKGSNELENELTYENDIIEDEQSEQGMTVSASFLEPAQIEKELYGEMNYVPVINENILYDVFELSNKIKSGITDVGEYSFLSYSIIEEKVGRFLHKDEGYSDEMLNVNNEVGYLLNQANKIDEKNRITPTIKDYLLLMGIYEEAFKLAPCSRISLQLSRPYEEIILIHPIFNTDDCNKVFKYGLKAIEYFSKTLSYKQIWGSSDSDILYRIGKVYHRLGDIPNLKLELRKELYMISSAYFELSTLNEKSDDRYTYEKSYFCAMVNHKLGVISDIDNYFYLDKALKYYEKTINHGDVTDYNKYKSNQYMSEICNRLSSYIKEYGKNEYLKECRTYDDLSIDYKEKSDLLYKYVFNN